MIKSIITLLIIVAPLLATSQDFIVEVENNQTKPCVGDTIRVSHPSGLACDWQINEAKFNIIGSTVNSPTLRLKCLTPCIDTIKATYGTNTGWVVLTVSQVSANFRIMHDPLNEAIVNVISAPLVEPYVFPITFKWNWDDGSMKFDTIYTINEGEIFCATERHKYEKTPDSDSIFDISLVIKNGAGCFDSVQITDTIHTIFTAPNVFTPNNDGLNDFFTARTTGNIEFSMIVFSRWGNIVFESEKPSTSIVWDGRLHNGQLVSTGVYFYVITPTENTEAEKLTGFVHVYTPKE